MKKTIVLLVVMFAINIAHSQTVIRGYISNWNDQIVEVVDSTGVPVAVAKVRSDGYYEIKIPKVDMSIKLWLIGGMVDYKPIKKLLDKKQRNRWLNLIFIDDGRGLYTIDLKNDPDWY